MNTYGIAFGGGGARGAYHIGVWKALTELEIPVGIVTGTSVGALNGALYVQGDFEQAYKIWTNISIYQIIDFNSPIEKNEIKSYSVLKSVIRSMFLGRLDTTPLKKLVSEVVDDKKIRESNIDFGLVTYSLTDLEPLNLYKADIPEGQISDYLLASACFPTFAPHKVNNKTFIDGAVYDNLPISLIADKNIKNIISVDISPIGIKKKIDTSGLNIINLKPSHDLGNLLDFNGESSIKNVEIGYCDTMKAFGRLKGKRYFFIHDDDFINNKSRFVSSLSPDDFKRLYHYLGLDWSEKPASGNTLIIYNIMNTLSKYTEGKLSGDTILPAMLEITAEQLGIDRRKKFTISEIIDEILNEYENVKNSKDYKEYIDKLGKVIFDKNIKHYDKEFKSTLKEGKFVVFYNPDLMQDDENIKLFRRFLAATFPKISIANMLIAFLLSKKESLKNQA